MYLLGVDGGSTKIDFLVTDLKGKKVFEHRIYSGSNLKYVGPDNVIKNLQKGFEIIEANSGIQLQDISSAYLGIAECGEHSGILGRDDVMEFVKQHLHNFVLADDQFSVFYSIANSPNGVLANAGTGSNINRFHNGLSRTYKSLGHGGRDFGKLILLKIKYGVITPKHATYKVIEEFLEEKPEDFYHDLSPSDYIIHPKITQLAKTLHVAGKTNPKILQELKETLVMIAGRWGSKISAYCYANFNYKPEEEFDIVLTGGMWGWTIIKDIAVQEIARVFPKAKILHKPDIKPVVGCVKLAGGKLKNQ